MPQWSNRLLPPKSRPEPSPTAPQSSASSATPARIRGPSTITESDILESAYGIPTLVPPSASHGRSMSHPFPSLFSTKKKRAGNGAATTDFRDDNASNSLPHRLDNIGKHSEVSDKDLRTGRCMTCDSMTVNDLKPFVAESRRVLEGHGSSHAPRAGAYSGSAASQKVFVISIEKTRQIIDRCITGYLMERMKHDSERSSLESSPNLLPTTNPRRFGTQGVNPNDPAMQSLNPQVERLNIPIRPPGRNWPRESDADVETCTRVSPYSTPSSGGFLAAHMDQHEHNQQSKSFDRRAPGPTFESDGIAPPRASNATLAIFRDLEDYITDSLSSFDCINNSFATIRPGMAPRTASEGSRRRPVQALSESPTASESVLSELDAKILLLGDFAENGSWWTGDRLPLKSPDRVHGYRSSSEAVDDHPGIVNSRSPHIDWMEVNEWYHLVLNAGYAWQQRLGDLKSKETGLVPLRQLSSQDIRDIDNCIMSAQEHCQRVLLKISESLLKRPGRPIKEPDDLRFLLILMSNPLLYPQYPGSRRKDHIRTRSRSRSRDGRGFNDGKQPMAASSRGPLLLPIQPAHQNASRGSSGQHSGIIKRIIGLLSNTPNECHHHLVGWFARLSEGQFQRIKDLIGSFVTYRLTRQQGKRREVAHNPTAGLVPSISGQGRNTSAALHAALGGNVQAPKKSETKLQPLIYDEDWQIKAAARVMALLFSANNSGIARKADKRSLRAFEAGHSAGLAAREKAHSHGQILPTSDFYNTLLDYSDLIADFEAWEGGRSKFTFCQYPFFLSIWAKIQIMEHDAKRQMEVKAREAFFDSIMTRKTINQYLILKIRRDCLVEDSLKGVSEVVGGGGEEIKKGLRIEFKGEEGIDAGGLRKEWFLLLVRDVFNPEHGMFTYDEDSHFCYFNPNSFETTDQFFLVGVVLGLAIYNSTILDVALPPFAFRKLLAAGPAAAPGATSHAKPTMVYSLDDLAEFRPSLANGLRQLLEFNGDVESTFCRDFVADVDRYGQTTQVPLCPGGESKPVTNTNRREFVDLYVRYLLDTAVVRQFEPFKRGFFTVCGGNALSLFRPEEIELLIRGSDEHLDIASLRAVCVYENWGVDHPETEPVAQWFWESFERAQPKEQRKLLSFITGSDRIPATGATTMVIKLSCLGPDSPRFPVARTCFNMLSLWRYSSRSKLEDVLWRAVHMSEGFGLK
ncbi:HECT-domain-containing protein [Coleophoma crateriformis]|uniref:HECT-type E3 ubiquitin transferase n=1 Tax=Coleophoma crateriformis TaxID=565419 RepID=A0A3D8RNQ6_9HELO|nr:HECT-domain-containing protein [Coleophoma crateriformis]